LCHHLGTQNVGDTNTIVELGDNTEFRVM
jgi:hypothetical protein